MHKKQNRLIAALLTLAMCLGVASPLSAFAENGNEKQTVQSYIVDKKYVGEGTLGEYSIGNMLLLNSTNLESLFNDTDSNLPFKVTKKGTTYVITLEQQTDGAAIELQDEENNVLPIEIVSDVTVELDLNGQTLKCANKEESDDLIQMMIIVQKDGTLIVEGNGTLETDYYALTVFGTLTAENVTIDAAYPVQTGGTVTLTKCKLQNSGTNDFEGGIIVDGGSCTLNDTDIATTSSRKVDNGVELSDGATFIMNGGSINSTKAGVSITDDETTATLNGVTINSAGTGVEMESGTLTIATLVDETTKQETATKITGTTTGVSVKEGTANISGAEITGTTAGISANSGAKVTIADTAVTGEIKGVKTSDLIDDSQYVVKDEETGTYQVAMRTTLKWDSSAPPTLKEDGKTCAATFTLKMPEGETEETDAGKIITNLNTSFSAATWELDATDQEHFYPTGIDGITNAASLITYVNNALNEKTKYMVDSETAPARLTGNVGDDDTEGDAAATQGDKDTISTLIVAVELALVFFWDRLPMNQTESTAAAVAPSAA